jgi:peptidoglycan/LPS O-acetylase OafA/YrhL
MPLALSGDNYPVLVVGNAALAISGAALVVGLDYAAVPLLRRVLSLRSLVTIGVLSYGIYLWHGPVMRFAADLGHEGRSWRAAMVVVSIVAAALSHRFVEAPIRTWARRRGGAGANLSAGATAEEAPIRAATAAAAAAD